MQDSRTVRGRLDALIQGAQLQADAAQVQAAAMLDELLVRLLRRRSGMLKRVFRQPPERGVYLWGGVGRGKTLLMDLFVAALPAARVQRHHFYHFMRRVHEELGRVKDQADPLALVAQRIAGHAHVLCLDEFFVADIADAMLLSGLFEGLFRGGATLVCTSNLAPHELYADGLQRQRFLPAIDLLSRHVDIVRLDSGTDYRLRQLELAPIYLDSAAPATQEELRRRFTALAGVAPAGPAALSVEGRTLHAVDTGPGMVWFEFTELCEGPRSQNDYIDIARLYHTVVIAHVPVFDEYADDAARRFIMLIDELYDRGVKILVSAAAAPAALYRGSRLAFAFDRASSRLIEMQTQAYLAGQHRP